MTRCKALCLALGWQGGTIHQVAKETRCNSTILVHGEHLYCADYINGWNTGRACSPQKNAREHLETKKMNYDFWLGVAHGIMFDEGANFKK